MNVSGRRAWRWLGAALLAFVVLGAGALAATYGVVRASLPDLDDRLVAPTLRADVTIERDSRGVPTIDAASRADAAYALGFAHAQDRYFQMDLARRVSGGRLAELFGDDAIDTDRENRRHRFAAVADAVLADLPAGHRTVLEAYVEGVNAGLQRLSARPFEYRLLGAEPEPWTTRDSLLVVFAMYLQLNDADASTDLQRGLVYASLPRELADFVCSVAPEWEAPIDGQVATAVPIPTASQADLRAVPEPRAARKTATLPSRAPGSNGHIAWGFTNSYGDFSDLVLVERSADGRQYRTADGWEPLAERHEPLLSSSGRKVDLAIRETRWGPLLSSTFAGRSLALNWTAHHPEATNLRWLDLERVTTTEAALALVPTLGGPVQNFVVGDRNGHIGWTLLGRLPRRGAGYDPTRPADWTQPDSGWDGWLDPGEYPRVVDPESGQLWSANNRVVGGDALALIGDGSPDRGARAQQIRDGLRALGPAAPGDMLAIQLDDRALYLAPTQRRLVALLDDRATRDAPQRAAFRDLVAAWNARASADSVGYRLVRSYRVELERVVFEMLIREARTKHPQATFSVPASFARPVDALLDAQPPHLLGAPYASWRDLELAVLDAVLVALAQECPAGLARCRWGDYNVVSIRHPMSRALPWLRHRLDMPQLPTAGDNDMPRVHLPGFGASERFAISPGHEADSYLHMPAGQSGHPLSPYYRAGHDDWVEGRPTPLLPGPAQHRQQLLAGNGPGDARD